jgi:hypothetical protein
MATIRIRVDASSFGSLGKKWKKAAKFIRPAIRRVMEKHGKDVVKEVISKQLSGRPGLISRTGKLKRSLKYRVLTSGKYYRLEIQSRSPYAVTHEEGMTITAKVSKLTVPLTPELKEQYPTPQNPAILKIKVRPGEGLFLVERANPTRITHSLRDSVYIPPRLKLRETVINMVPKLTRNLRNRIIKHLENPGSGPGR